MRRARFLRDCLLLLLAASACSRNPDRSAASPLTPTAEAQPTALRGSTATGPDRDAVAALKTMSDYLSKLHSFELVSDASLDAITKANQRIQIGGIAHYKVRQPGIRLDFDTDTRSRRYFYDGKQFTIYSPKLRLYASAPAPPTNRAFLKALYEKYGISLPLEDLFRWNDGDESDLKSLTSGFNVGPAMIDGVATDHWAFRQGKFDWEVWIERGQQPLPRKLVIVDRSDPTYPAYIARLKWTLNPPFADNIFKFTPDNDAARIHIAQFAG